MKGWRLVLAGLVAAFALTFVGCAGRGGTREPQHVNSLYRCDKCTATSAGPKSCCGENMKRVDLAP